jgi:hypothetical protein
VDSGLDSSIMSPRGYGKSSPRVPSTSAQARAKNRRVEIGIVDVALRYERRYIHESQGISERQAICFSVD